MSHILKVTLYHPTSPVKFNSCNIEVEAYYRSYSHNKKNLFRNFPHILIKYHYVTGYLVITIDVIKLHIYKWLFFYFKIAPVVSF